PGQYGEETSWHKKVFNRDAETRHYARKGRGRKRKRPAREVAPLTAATRGRKQKTPPERGGVLQFDDERSSFTPPPSSGWPRAARRPETRSRPPWRSACPSAWR